MKKTDNEYISSVCLELGLLIKAGISPAECFSLLAESEKDKPRRAMLEKISDTVDSGSALAPAMAAADAFPKYLTDMVRVGERTGYLEQVFSGLADYYRRQADIAAAVRGAVVYPLIQAGTMAAVILIVIIAVLPVFQDVFAQLGATLSGAALALLHAGVWISKNGWIFGCAAAVIAAAAVLTALVPALRTLWNRFWSRITAGSKIGKKTVAARFASAMELGLRSGLDTDSALELAQRLSSGTGAAKSIDRIRERVMDGAPFSDAVEQSGILGPQYCRMLSVGVRTGAADRVMAEIARRSSDELDTAIDKNVGSVEPVLVTVMCLMVGLILLAVMLPLMGVMTAIG